MAYELAAVDEYRRGISEKGQFCMLRQLVFLQKKNPELMITSSFRNHLGLSDYAIKNQMKVTTLFFTLKSMVKRPEYLEYVELGVSLAALMRSSIFIFNFIGTWIDTTWYGFKTIRNASTWSNTRRSTSGMYRLN